MKEIKEEEDEENANDNYLFDSFIEPVNSDDNVHYEDEWGKKSCIGKCCFYALCCCCCTTFERNINLYQKGWQNYLKTGESSDKTFQALTNLFANAEDAITCLEDIRLNPNLVGERKVRSDLEFYIPQLCTFLLFGEVKAIEEFFVFLCKVCNASFFFAHRVHWFLAAMINSSQEKKEQIMNILKMVNTLFKSENRNLKNKLTYFYITNSEPYINYIKTNKLYFLYDNKNISENNNNFDKLNANTLDMDQQNSLRKYKNTRDRLSIFCDNEYRDEVNKELNKLREAGKLKNISKVYIENIEGRRSKTSDNIAQEDKELKPDEIFIDISKFKLENNDITYDEDEVLEEGKEEALNLQDSSGILGVSKVSYDINYISYHSTINFIDHLCDISNELPKKPIDEQKLFLFEEINKINKKLPCNVYLPFLKDSTRNYLVCHIPLDGIKIFRTKTRCPIMLTFELLRMNEIMDEPEEVIDLNRIRKRTMAVKGIKNKMLNDIITSNNKVDYSKADVEISKPMMINKNIEKKTIKHINVNDKGVKAPIVIDQNYSKKFQNLLDKFKINHQYQAPKNPPPPKQQKKMNFKDDDSIISVKRNSKLLAEKLIENSKNENETEGENEKKMDSSMEITLDDSLLPQKKNKSLDPEIFRNIFGDTFEQKEQNLKKTSIFGHFKTHKIFRCIFKTHEDLRQEQFATQLINEFDQIFKIENTNCWVNTYEIISTGNDAGLVEMVNNSISLDQFYQKLNNMNLFDFYKYYWGNGQTNSPQYKTAMNNFIASIAGYSLVCYFLQIKDRHNGNILIDNEGHLTHIDFGFLLSNAPGKGLKFENAPFKLSKDMVQCLGGIDGENFKAFKKLLLKGFLAVHKHRQKIIILVEMMYCGHGRNLDCFEKGQEAIDELKLRLAPKDCKTDDDIRKFVEGLINQSVDNWRTKWYDIFQYYAQGIYY